MAEELQKECDSKEQIIFDLNLKINQSISNQNN